MKDMIPPALPLLREHPAAESVKTADPPARQTNRDHTFPWLVHQTWKHEHLRWPLSACVDSFKKWNPHWQHNLWTDSTCEALIRDHLPDFLPTYLAYPPGILRADIFRVAVLYIQGGVYADLDMECLRPLDDLIAACGGNASEAEVLLGRDHPCHERTHYESRTMWLNAFMIARPGAKFLRHVLDAFTRQVASGYPKHDAVQATGPGLLTRIVELGDSDLPALGITEMPWQWVHPLPNVFVRFEERSRYKRLIRTREWRAGKQARLQEHDDTFRSWGEPPFAVHYWWHSYIENCREVNMLLKFAPRLLQSDGEIVERRLNDLPPAALEDVPQSLGEALCVLGERQGSRIRLVGKDLPRPLHLAVRSAGQGLKWEVELEGQTSGGPADLIIANRGDSSRPLDFTEIRRGLSPRGIVLFLGDDKDSSKAISPSPLDLRTVYGHQALWERPPAAHEEIPRMLHLFDAGADGQETRFDHAARSSWQHFHPRPWRICRWDLARMEQWVLKHVPAFAATYFDYPTDEHRLQAGRWLVLSRLGGVALRSSTVATRALEGDIRWKSLLVEAVKNPDGSLLLSDHQVASSPGHPFWRGLGHALETARHRPLSDATGSGFLTERARAASAFLDKADWPVVADPGTLTFSPPDPAWRHLVTAGMWDALTVLYPDSASLIAPADP